MWTRGKFPFEVTLCRFHTRWRASELHLHFRTKLWLQFSFIVFCSISQELPNLLTLNACTLDLDNGRENNKTLRKCLPQHCCRSVGGSEPCPDSDVCGEKMRFRAVRQQRSVLVWIIFNLNYSNCLFLLIKTGHGISKSPHHFRRDKQSFLWELLFYKHDVYF